MPEFTYFGEQFSYAEEFPAFEFAEFQEARAEDDLDYGRAMGIALRLAVACVAEGDRGRFRKVSRANRAKVDDWLAVFRDFTTEEAERPTGPSTASGSGRENTQESSESQPIALVTSLTEPEPVRPVRADLALALSRSA